MKKILKLITFCFALSMVMGLGMMKEAWAAQITCYTCSYCGTDFHVADFNSEEEAINAAMACEASHYSSSTAIDLQNSVELVSYDTLDKINGTNYFNDETTNEWTDGQIVEEVRVRVDVESVFTICESKTLSVIRKLYGNKVFLFFFAT